MRIFIKKEWILRNVHRPFYRDYDPCRDCNLCGVKTEMGFAWAEIDDRKSGGRKNGRITVCSGKLRV